MNNDSRMTRRIFLRRAGSAAGIVAILPSLGLPKILGVSDYYRYYEHTILAMGTTARLGIYATSELEANRIINLAFAELKRLEAMLTIFDSTSEISSINRNAGENPTPVSPEVWAILDDSVRFSELSHGAFDITVEPLMRLWGFRSDSPVLQRLPSDKEVESTLEVVGMRMIEFDSVRRTVTLRARNAKLDLGGIAVGFALDRIADILRGEGVRDAFLDISGDIIALGRPRHHESGWPVAIPDPRNLQTMIYSTAISDCALATSGSYMSYVVYQARTFGHIMDPHLGISSECVLSTTAISSGGTVVDGGTTVDALSTASFVTGTPIGHDAKFVIVNNSGELSCNT